MTVHRLHDLVDEHLARARAASAARSAQTISDQGPLRQTLIALAAGASLPEHEAPRAATLQVLRGSARLVANERATDLVAGDLTDIPRERHALEALIDTAVVLTVLAD